MIIIKYASLALLFTSMTVYAENSPIQDTNITYPTKTTQQPVLLRRLYTFNAYVPLKWTLATIASTLTCAAFTRSSNLLNTNDFHKSALLAKALTFISGITTGFLASSTLGSWIENLQRFSVFYKGEKQLSGQDLTPEQIDELGEYVIEDYVFPAFLLQTIHLDILPSIGGTLALTPILSKYIPLLSTIKAPAACGIGLGLLIPSLILKFIMLSEGGKRIESPKKFAQQLAKTNPLTGQINHHRTSV